jgi:hypothetical protein
MDLENKLDQIEIITTKMDIPILRRRDVRWLIRNVGVRNSDHPDFLKLIDLLKQAIKETSNIR